MGTELWGTYDDMRTLYEVLGKFWNQYGFTEKAGFDSRDKIISSFIHEIRKAYEGSRLTRECSHFMPDQIPHFGCQLSWVHVIFSMNAIRFNMRFFESNKLDLGVMLQLEYWLEEAMRSFDPQGATRLIGYLSGGIEAANPYLYQFMRSINADFFELRGGKTAFRKLGQLFKRAVYGTEEYHNHNAFLMVEAHKLECEIGELELSDDHIDYDKLIW
ncbi:DUF6904 family protein [Pedobacter steynii]